MPESIRREQESDIPRIRQLHRAAFGRPAEADIVDRLRGERALWLSHVALRQGEIVGHAAWSMARVSGGERSIHCPALGPIAVLPAHQGRGIGAALIRCGIASARAAGCSLLFVVGAPAYYRRFGFRPAIPLGFTSDYAQQDGPHEHVMTLPLIEDALASASGHLRYHLAFADA